ncbi:hypothetical protein GCM10011391_32150 [Pullulanibacillus camelliae]|uniref:Uncharacterized protein n=1 Tax=Pullulanibacillus camelliae TaxID=1707096 RepID=A0A8J3DZ86_9BACL|nr:hypothetical protein [Pullulanibacillus camelliae]GGE50922.1 hypothetical protein GCM10011391_32150 [Pullulanibacillus camelliae]
MNQRLQKAVLNNISWCSFVCDTHEIKQTATENLWGTLSKAPAFYPDLITKNSHVTENDVWGFINNRKVGSIKDSFATLNLSAMGFKVLLEAEWIYHEPLSERESTEPLQWQIIAAETELSKWTALQGSTNSLKPSLLKRPEIKFFLREKKEGIEGFIANAGAGVIGVSNVFSSGVTSDNLWTDIVKELSVIFPDTPLVGYEHSEALHEARRAGWSSLGPLQIWVSRNL